jgi:hypothetical protein
MEPERLASHTVIDRECVLGNKNMTELGCKADMISTLKLRNAFNELSFIELWT